MKYMMGAEKELAKIHFQKTKQIAAKIIDDYGIKSVRAMEI